MINLKTVNINNRYVVEITFHDNNNIRLYQLIDKTTEKAICESFNRDSFLLKANKIVKISNDIECLIASY